MRPAEETGGGPDLRQETVRAWCLAVVAGGLGGASSQPRPTSWRAAGFLPQIRIMILNSWSTISCFGILASCLNHHIYRDLYRPPKPEGIESRRAFIIGGGLAGLSAAAFLIRDASMPGENITILEAGGDIGGSLDGSRGAKGYLCRGERELEPTMQCLWYLCAYTPSLENPGRTVLDDIVSFNKDEPQHNETRAFVRQGHIVADMHDSKLSDRDQADIQRLLLTPEAELEDMTIEQYFQPSVFGSNFWLDFHTKLAFKPIHSVMECRRYMLRFFAAKRSEYNESILHTEYNEYDAIIQPVRVWLVERGVNFECRTEVTDIVMDDACDTVLEILANKADAPLRIPVRPEDMVFFTNGSMVQNSAFGDNDTVAPFDRSGEHLGLFEVWKKVAARSEKFGHPEKFLGNVDQMTFVSYFPTITGYPEFIEKLEDMTGTKAGTAGAISVKDSNWEMGFILHHKPFFPGQPEDVDVFWGNGLSPDKPGNYVRKPMLECTGAEILTEFCYHMGLLDMLDDLLAHTYVSVAAMPYITSQFSPRRIVDRPLVVPEGCVNLAFIGQFVEVPDDVVFTVETSVRTALNAVYALTKLDKEPVAVLPAKYDIRNWVYQFRANIGKMQGDITEHDLPPIKPTELFALRRTMARLLSSIPVPEPLFEGRDKSILTKVSVLQPKAPLDTQDWA
jgi:oleate hydratase